MNGRNTYSWLTGGCRSTPGFSKRRVTKSAVVTRVTTGMARLFWHSFSTSILTNCLLCRRVSGWSGVSPGAPIPMNRLCTHIRPICQTRNSKGRSAGVFSICSTGAGVCRLHPIPRRSFQWATGALIRYKLGGPLCACSKSPISTTAPSVRWWT